MVDILVYQFLEHLAGMFLQRFVADIACVAVSAGTYQWDFCPKDESVLVTHVIHRFGVRIVCQADGCRAYFLDEVQVCLVVFGCECAAFAGDVLVAAESVEVIGFSVQEETFLRVGLEVAEACLFHHLVELFAVLVKVDLHGVEVGIVYAVPQGGVFDGERLAHVVAGDIYV